MRSSNANLLSDSEHLSCATVLYNKVFVANYIDGENING